MLKKITKIIFPLIRGLLEGKYPGKDNIEKKYFLQKFWLDIAKKLKIVGGKNGKGPKEAKPMSLNKKCKKFP